MRPVPPALPVDDYLESPRIVLRDGTVASIRAATAGDRERLQRFFHDLSPESRRRRFFTTAEPSEGVVARLSEAHDPSAAFTLVVDRLVADDVRPIATASYLALNGTTAEVAFAVDDHFQGKGLGSSLLERLAVVAAHHGFERFQATTLAENLGMLEVFRDSGFEIRSKSEAGCVELQLSLAPSAEGVRRAEERDRVATVASLRPMLVPRAVAVVGASRDVTAIGRRVFDALRAAQFNGPVYPVNAHAAEIDGVPCYSSARQLPGNVDLAVIAVPRDAVIGSVDDCAAAGVKSVVVITAGFAEVGDAGRALQRELVVRVRNHGMRMVGPNCMGLLNAAPDVRLNASFSPVMPSSGRVAFSSQSGALGLAILQLARERGVGLSTFVSVGNKGDVSGNDLLQYWENDHATSVILLYLESFGNARRFGRLARRIARTKPIVAVKAGRTRAGSRAAGSHTAALAANDAAVNALFQQSGVIRADTIDEMFDIAACLEVQPLPAGRRVAIVTNAGGPGILAVDACEAAGLTVVEFSAGTRQKLADFLPAEASIGNPVDMVASAGPETYRRAVEIALSADEADSLIVIVAPVDLASADAILSAIREGIVAGRRVGAAPKPVLACVMAEPGKLTPLVADGETIPTYAFPENAARALGKIATYAVWRSQPPALFWGFDDIQPADARELCREVLQARGDSWLTGEEVRRLLNAFGLPLVPAVLARTADDAAAMAAVMGYPVVAKLQTTKILHKSDAGAVRGPLTSERALRTAFRELSALAAAHDVTARDEGVVVQPMVSGGIETIIGVTDDRLFGPLVAFGLGGVHVELVGDVRFRVAPLTDRDTDELMREIRGYRLLEGYRGHPPADIDALREIILRIARLAEELPEIVELDLNPVIALPPGKGCRIVDARVRIAARPHAIPETSDSQIPSVVTASPTRAITPPASASPYRSA
jgi:acetate---CoA ligase (ADP-forming)